MGHAGNDTLKRVRPGEWKARAVTLKTYPEFPQSGLAAELAGAGGRSCCRKARVSDFSRENVTIVTFD